MSRSCFGKNVPNFYRQSDLDPEKWTTYVSLVVSYQEVDVPNARLLAGESVRSLAEELSISRATIYKWKHQALIDAGKRPGTKSFEVDTLAQARRTIRDLEAELALVKAASDLFNANEPISPKASSRLPEG